MSSARRICSLILELFELRSANHGGRDRRGKTKGIFKRTDERTDQVDKRGRAAWQLAQIFVIEPPSSLSLSLSPSPSLLSMHVSSRSPSNFWFKTIAVAQQRGSETPSPESESPSPCPLPRSVKRRKAPCFTPPHKRGIIQRRRAITSRFKSRGSFVRPSVRPLLAPRRLF